MPSCGIQSSNYHADILAALRQGLCRQNWMGGKFEHDGTIEKSLAYKQKHDHLHNMMFRLQLGVHGMLFIFMHSHTIF